MSHQTSFNPSRLCSTAPRPTRLSHTIKQFGHTFPLRALCVLPSVCLLAVYPFTIRVSCRICHAAILPRRRCGPEENVPGKESRPAVSALCLVSVHPGHRQAHQEVCPLAGRSRYDFKRQHTHTHTVTQQVQTISHKNAFSYSQRAPLLILTVTRAYGIKWDYEIK